MTFGSMDQKSFFVVGELLVQWTRSAYMDTQYEIDSGGRHRSTDFCIKELCTFMRILLYFFNWIYRIIRTLLAFRWFFTECPIYGLARG